MVGEARVALLVAVDAARSDAGAAARLLHAAGLRQRLEERAFARLAERVVPLARPLLRRAFVGRGVGGGPPREAFVRSLLEARIFLPRRRLLSLAALATAPGLLVLDSPLHVPLSFCPSRGL